MDRNEVAVHAGSWDTLNPPLSLSIRETLRDLGFSQMTPVQASTIPMFMKNKDVIVEAVTGSGKTLAFVIPVLEKLLRREHPLKHSEVGALIISPTRELAQQIHSVFEVFLPPHPNIYSALFIGGTTTPSEDLRYFKEHSPQIVIGTPGRLEELLASKSNVIQTKELEILVLDEADRLLDMGFERQLRAIINVLPKQRRTGLFSATMTDALGELIRVGLRNPVRVTVKVEDLRGGKEQKTPATLQIHYLICESDQKISQMIRLLHLSQLRGKKIIVYFSTCACVDHFYKLFSRLTQLKDFSIHSLHGQMDTKRRTATYKNFTSLTSTSPALLLCTDVASRGLDIPDVDVVIQMDPPQDPKVFSHRCGRTARAGKEGAAYLFLQKGREETYVEFLKLRKIPLQPHPYLLFNLKSYEANTTDVTSPNYLIPDNDLANTQLLDDIRALILTDRAFSDSAAKAFVSYFRAYSKHEASFIFRVKDLKLEKLARLFGVLRMPKMPELKDMKFENFIPADVDWNSYRYADKTREKERLRKLKEGSERMANGNISFSSKPKSSTPWSAQKAQKEKRDLRKLKKKRKIEFLNTQPAKRSKEVLSDDEWEMLQKEERLAKKVRKGKMNEKEFEEAVCLSENENERDIE